MFDNRSENKSPMQTLTRRDEQQYLQWKQSFVYNVSKSVKSYKKYPGHGARLPDLHDLMDSYMLDYFIKSIDKVVVNEIGRPHIDFDQIVTLESQYSPDFGALFAT